MTFETVWAVYYSGTGTTRRVLQTMAAAAGEALGIPDILGEPDLRGAAAQCAAAFFAAEFFRWGSGCCRGGAVWQPQL